MKANANKYEMGSLSDVELRDEGSEDTVCGRLLGLFNSKMQDCRLKLDVKSANVSGEMCIDFSELWISPFKSSKEYGSNQIIWLWQKTGFSICAGP